MRLTANISSNGNWSGKSASTRAMTCASAQLSPNAAHNA
jgi:hypothetical protein